MVNAFRAIGMVCNNGMGLVAIPFAEIAGFIASTGRIGPGWEAETLRNMSCAYLHGQAIGKNPLGIAPWETDE